MRWLGWVWLLSCKGPEVSDAPADAPETSETGTPSTPTSPDVDVLRSRLEAMGFVIREGREAHIPIETCCDWISCFKWNPSSYYVYWWLPLGPDEPSEGRELDADGLQYHWRLRSDEAVLGLGPTPPPMRYHSYRTYVHATWSEALDTQIPGFNNLGDSLNQVFLETEGDAYWDAETVVISAADARVEGMVREALQQAGYPEDWFNTDVIPADVVELGLHLEADTVRMNHRVAMFDDPAQEAAWLEEPPSTVWRLSLEEPLEDFVPLERAAFVVGGREPGDDESDLAPAVEALGDAILAAHPDLQSVETPVNVRQIPEDDDCWAGCNRDALESNTIAVRFPEGPDHRMVIFGVNHHLTGRAAYFNAIVFGSDNDDPGAHIDDRALVGSARAYLPDHPDADLLYAWTFSRDCDDRPYCTEIVTGCPGVELDEPASIHFRSYMDPATGVAAKQDEVVGDRVFVFKPPETPTKP